MIMDLIMECYLFQEAAKTISPKEAKAEEEPKVKDEEETEQPGESKADVEAPESEAMDETKEVQPEEAESGEPNEKSPPIEPNMAPPQVPVKEVVEVKEVKLDVKYSCDNKKTAFKDGEYINIASITEARVRIKGFDSGANTQGKANLSGGSTQPQTAGYSNKAMFWFCLFVKPPPS